MRMRIVFAVAAGLVTGVLTMAGTVTAAGAAASGYVLHRCYVSNLAARFHGAQAAWGAAASC